MFVSDLTATQTSHVIGLNRKTVNSHFLNYRKIIFKLSLNKFDGSTNCFCISFNSHNKIKIREHDMADSKCDAVVDHKLKYKRIESDKKIPRNRKIDMIDTFWAFTRPRLIKLNGISSKFFYLHLAESEFRFNNRKLSKKELAAIICAELKLSR